jgi:hypothetical protein
LKEEKATELGFGEITDSKEKSVVLIAIYLLITSL